MLALTTYFVVGGFHVIFVLLALGVAFSFTFISMAARKDPPHMLFALSVIRKIQETLVLPGLVLVFITGSYLASDGGWYDRPNHGWLIVGQAWFVLAALASAFLGYPAVKTMQREATKMAENPGPPSAAFMAKAKLMKWLSPTISISVLGIAFLMEAKPF